jgi:hypothetical protein
MKIELTDPLAEQLRSLAARQDRDINALVETALWEYLEAASITDLVGSEIAETQMAMLSEQRGTPFEDIAPPPKHMKGTRG